MEFEKKPFDPINAEQEEWDRFFNFDEKMHQILRPNDPLSPREKRKQGLILQAESEELEFNFQGLYQANKYDELIGIFLTAGFAPKNPSYEANKALMITETILLPEYRQNGIMKSLLKDIYDEMVEKEKMVLIANSEEDVIIKVAEKVGAQIAQVNIENRAYIKDVPWDMMDEWIEDGAKRNPTTRLEFHNKMPDNRMEAYLATFNETMNLVPRDDLAINDMTETEKSLRESEERSAKLGNTRIYCITVEENGDVSSLTTLGYNPETPTRMGVGLTGVPVKYRGRGLGKWCKAAIMKHAKDNYEGLEYINTGNATSNAPMLSINNRIGFKKFKEQYTAQMMLPQLKAYLERQSIEIAH
ncbi:MAG: hypothetical protein INQ03_20100 [Candidatus Heimdallarchaeota archaeon]|nr:hypothetical protein [Candidatus Heimdallarchaeota archaeon]